LITDADRLRDKTDAPMCGGSAAADGGLFDLVGRGQVVFFDQSLVAGLVWLGFSCAS